jgi:hypothetical protein
MAEKDIDHPLPPISGAVSMWDDSASHVTEEQRRKMTTSSVSESRIPTDQEDVEPGFEKEKFPSVYLEEDAEPVEAAPLAIRVPQAAIPGSNPFRQKNGGLRRSAASPYVPSVAVVAAPQVRPVKPTVYVRPVTTIGSRKKTSNIDKPMKVSIYRVCGIVAGSLAIAAFSVCLSPTLQDRAHLELVALGVVPPDLIIHRPLPRLAMATPMKRVIHLEAPIAAVKPVVAVAHVAAPAASATIPASAPAAVAHVTVPLPAALPLPHPVEVLAEVQKSESVPAAITGVFPSGPVPPLPKLPPDLAALFAPPPVIHAPVAPPVPTTVHPVAATKPVPVKAPAITLSSLVSNPGIDALSVQSKTDKPTKAAAPTAAVLPETLIPGVPGDLPPGMMPVPELTDNEAAVSAADKSQGTKKGSGEPALPAVPKTEVAVKTSLAPPAPSAGDGGVTPIRVPGTVPGASVCPINP